MRCPHCGVNIRFEEFEPAIILPYDKEEKAGLSVELIHGSCPACDELIVKLKEGQYDSKNGFTSITKEETIYPKVNLPKPLDATIPEEYRRDYTEAFSVLTLSAKASAAISRRLLQHIIREDYKIKKGSLDKEIEEFIHLGNIPSHITDAVDAVRNVGNFAAHPLKDTNTGEIVEVEPGEAEWLLEVLDALFDFTFVQPKRIQDRRDKLNQKLTAMGKPPLKS
ncbi:MAG TPA: DUF4145 domain-containing protein [Pyrinomonadaceae bacterium]|nr:DUF4145 domain-containing protein [Pyrinomonadaceae bacterium]